MKTRMATRSMLLSLSLIGLYVLASSEAAAQPAGEPLLSGISVTAPQRFAVEHKGDLTVYQLAVELPAAKVSVVSEISVDNRLREHLLARGYRGLQGDAAVAAFAAETLADNAALAERGGQTLRIHLQGDPSTTAFCFNLKFCFFSPDACIDFGEVCI